MEHLYFLYFFGLALNQPLSWSSQIIFLLWRCDSHLVQTAKLQQYVQNDVIITTLDVSVFPKISTTTIFHVNSCEITKSEISLTYDLLLPECLPIGATMINRQWFYNCQELYVHHNIFITKLWAPKYYLLYLHGIISTLFYIEDNSFLLLNRQFSMFFSSIKLDTNISNWLILVLT